MNRHSKRINAAVCAVLLVAVLFSSGFTLRAVQVDFDCVPVYINGIREMDGAKIEGTTYVPLKAFCQALVPEAEAEWDQENGVVTVTADGLELVAQVGGKYLVANEKPLYIENGVVNLEGTVIVPVRVIAEVFGAAVNWTPGTRSVHVSAAVIEYIGVDETTYVQEDLYWLSRLIYAESGNQPLDGMIAVGNVVLNRVESERFPDSIYGVISQVGQFDVFSGGGIYMTPNKLSVIAAKLCLDGVTVLEDALFFVNPDIGADNWFKANLTYITTIDDHDFYA